MHGYLSRDGMAPTDLLAGRRQEVTGYGVELVEDEVLEIDSGFSVRLAGGQVLSARRSDRNRPPRRAAGDPRSPRALGPEVRDRPLGVLGTQPN